MKMLIAILLTTLMTAGAVFAEDARYEPERYDVIIDRSPFGSDPLVDTASLEQKAKAAAAAAAKELRLCFLLETQGGEIRAGFQNLKPQKGDPKSVILMVGESFMGMKLLDVDLENSQATLDSRGEQVVFELTKAPTPAKKPAPPAAQAQAQQPQRRFGGGFRRREPPPEPKPAPKLSPEEEQRRREEIRANLQEYQMEVIRQGMPPLPIPLTAEMDEQLVAEGVLPPQEEPQQ
jgi:hypothetical protein